MDEIKVVPYIPDEDYDNPAMVVDFYEFTMANCLFLHGFKDTTLVFDMFFRKNPDNQGYSISAGQRKLTRFLLNYHFNAQDIWWLRTKGMSEEFCEYLRTYQWKGDMYALPEGTVALLPWEWQLDRDDARHMEDYYKAVDALIRYLNTSEIKEWKEGRTYKMSQLLLIRSGADFDTYFPIDKSERTFMLLLPFIKEAQLLYVKKAYGNGWNALLTMNENNEAHFAACKAVTLLGMSIALKRMQLKIIPAGVIRGYVSASGAMESDPASIEDIKLLSEWMNDDAMVWIDEMKKARDGGAVTYNLLPENDKHNKYMRL